MLAPRIYANIIAVPSSFTSSFASCTSHINGGECVGGERRFRTCNVLFERRSSPASKTPRDIHAVTACREWSQTKYAPCSCHAYYTNIIVTPSNNCKNSSRSSSSWLSRIAISRIAPSFTRRAKITNERYSATCKFGSHMKINRITNNAC